MSHPADITLVNDIPFRVDLDQFLKAVHMDDSSPFVDDLKQFAHEAQAVAKPKGLYKLSTVDKHRPDAVAIDGLTFNSRILAVNLDGVHRVFPFIATCGNELDEWARCIDHPLAPFWADTIKQMALRAAFAAVDRNLVQAYGPLKRALMNPGSLEDWPLAQQKPLFSLFGGASDTIGVTLTESFLMTPIKSISGIWFETEQGFENCQLCPRTDCPGRRAPYDPHMIENYRDDNTTTQE